MAHWAEIDENNIVIRVTVGDNNDPKGDQGYQWLIDNLGGTWIFFYRLDDFTKSPVWKSRIDSYAICSCELSSFV